MIWTKGTHQSAKFQTFDCSRQISPNLYFDRLLLLKVDKISVKKVYRIYVSWHWRLMQSSKKNWFFLAEMTRIWWILTWALEILKISTLIGSFCAKYISFDLEKSSGVIFHDNEEWCKTWTKKWLMVWKMTWGIW